MIIKRTLVKTYIMALNYIPYKETDMTLIDINNLKFKKIFSIFFFHLFFFTYFVKFIFRSIVTKNRETNK